MASNRNQPSEERIKEIVATILRCDGNKAEAARQLKMPQATLYHQLDIGLRLYGIEIPKKIPKGRLVMEITDGVIYVGSDAHYLPGPPSTGHRAFVKFIKREKNLRVVVVNGDACDFPGISRHARIGWTSTPTVQQEIEVVAERLGEIEKAGGKARRVFPLGNHDARFETYIANHAPEIGGVKGTSLKDHLALWEPCWSLFVNDRPGGAVIKHRARGGIHGPHNNALWSGRHIITGHNHSQKIAPITDYNGTRFGCDTGCLADIYSDAFQSYLEDGFRNWIAGFARIKFESGRMLMPELIRVIDENRVEFRGELIEV
jgi:hypothetical protein